MNVNGAEICLGLLNLRIPAGKNEFGKRTGSIEGVNSISQGPKGPPSGSWDLEMIITEPGVRLAPFQTLQNQLPTNLVHICKQLEAVIPSRNGVLTSDSQLLQHGGPFPDRGDPGDQPLDHPQHGMVSPGDTIH